MKAITAVISMAALAGTVPGWHAYERHETAQKIARLADSTGFIPVVMPDGAPEGTVLILAPLNCPGAAARRADALAERLHDMGIPAVRTSQYTFNRGGRFQARDAAEADALRAHFAELRTQLEQTQLILGGELPAVLVKGRGRSNPSAEEVAVEYRREDAAARSD